MAYRSLYQPDPTQRTAQDLALSAPASGASSTLPSAAPSSPGTYRLSGPTGSPAVAGGPCAHGRALGATASALAPAEASDGPSRHRSSPHRGRYALGRTDRFLLARAA